VSTDLDALRAAARCTDCELSEDATQAVFGAGPPSAWLMLVGEQPGDREDLVRACRHWFDDETFRGLARVRGVQCGRRYAEGFHPTRMIVGAPGA